MPYAVEEVVRLLDDRDRFALALAAWRTGAPSTGQGRPVGRSPAPRHAFSSGFETFECLRERERVTFSRPAQDPGVAFSTQRREGRRAYGNQLRREVEVVRLAGAGDKTERSPMFLSTRNCRGSHGLGAAKLGVGSRPALAGP